MSSHRIFGRQLSVDTEHRKAIRRNLCQSLFEHGKIRTTLPRAKEIRAMAEKLITLARRNTLISRRRVISILQDRRLTDEDQEFTGQSVVQKLFTDIAPKFADRPGGYTRIIKLSDFRIGDGGSLVLLQLCTEENIPRGTIRRSAGLRRKRNQRRQEFASRAMKKSKPEPQEAKAAAEKSSPEKSAEPASTPPNE
jgi:large subunit ribosomal protein L17